MPVFRGTYGGGRPYLGICSKDWASVAKSQFPWAFLFVISMIEVTEYGLPTPEENETVNAFEEWLIESVRRATKVHFVAHVTGDGVRFAYCYLPEAEKAQRELQNIVKSATQRSFDFRIESDPNWALVSWITRRF